MSNTFNANYQVWDRHYSREKSDLQYPDENVVRYFSQFFKIHDKKHPFILDLGCGYGRHTTLLNRYPCKVISQDFVFSVLPNKNHPFAVSALAEKLPYMDNSFNCVLAWGILHYLSPKQVPISISSIHRVLKDKGVLLATIRAEEDTHITHVINKGDLEEGKVILYTKDMAISLFKNFSKVNYGFIMRQQLRQEHTIAHHIIEAIK